MKTTDRLSTTDYFQFTIMEHSRVLNEAAIQLVVDFVDQKKDGRMRRLVLIGLQLEMNPIFVTPKMKVIEGKHRLEIARRLELPVSYIIKGE